MTILYVLLALVLFGLLVVFHELGHFLMARLFRVTIREFSIGMGPRLFFKKGKKHDTEYSVRAFPIGGYVSMAGEDEESDDPNAFYKKPVWQRMLIVVMGPVLNVALGFLLMLVLVLSTAQLATNVVGEFDGDAVSVSHGLAIGDEIIKVGNVRVHTGNEVVYEIMNQGVAEASEGVVAIDLTVKRNGEVTYLPGVQFPSQEVQGVLFGSADFKVNGESKTVFNVIEHTFYRSFSTVKMIVDQFVDLLSGRYGLNAVSGPVGITQAVADAAKLGVMNVLYLITVITVNLGVFNLIPFPALDGGRLLFLAFEGITHRPVNKKIEGYINMAGLLLLFGVMIVVCCKDIVMLFIS